MANGRPVPVRNLILVPALITLAVTILRLVGELRDWNPSLFSKAPGGGGSLVGISWLVPLFGIYFGVRLAGLGFGPRSVWRAVGAAVAGFVVMMLSAVAANALHLSPGGALIVTGLGSLACVWIAALGWPALGGTLAAYGLAARIPVLLVMLFAIYGRWGTHYDVVDGEFSSVDTWAPFLKWLAIGAVPQLTAWIGYTVAVGMLFGAPAGALARRRAGRTAADSPAPAHA